MALVSAERNNSTRAKGQKEKSMEFALPYFYLADSSSVLGCVNLHRFVITKVQSHCVLGVCAGAGVTAHPRLNSCGRGKH